MSQVRISAHTSLFVLLVGAFVVVAGCIGGVTVPGQASNHSPSDALNPPAGSATPLSPTAASRNALSNATSYVSSSETSPSDAATTGSGTLSVHQINVGQSASTLVVGPTGETMLIDSGDYRDNGEEVLAYLKAHNITRIDYLVTSHADADHIGGHAAVINYYEEQANGIGAVYDPGYPSNSQTYQDYLDAVELHNVTLYKTRVGDSIPMEGATVRVLGPPKHPLANGERNENSIVLMITYGQSDFLFTGDAESTEEEYLLNTYGHQLQATILKAGHHGSSGSTSAGLLTATSPQAVVISSAYDSPYGHPNEETLQRLANRSLPAYWTAVHGNTVFTSNGSTVVVRTQRAATTDPLELRTEPPIEPGATTPLEQRAVIQAIGTPSPPPTQTPTGTTTLSETLTATQTPVGTDGGTITSTPAGETPSANLRVAKIQADPPGDDRENLTGEYVMLENTGNAPLDLSGWVLRDAADHAYEFPSGFTLDPRANVSVHTGSGSNTATDLYWGTGTPIWNNGGDTVTVVDANGTTVLEESY